MHLHFNNPPCKPLKEWKNALKKEELETLRALRKALDGEIKRKKLERQQMKRYIRLAVKYGYTVTNKTIETETASFKKVLVPATPPEEIGEMYKWTIGGSEVELRFLRLFSKLFGLEADKKYLEL
jgi:hypothetical protein